MGYYMTTLPLLRSFKMGNMQYLFTVVPLYNYVKHSVHLFMWFILFYFELVLPVQNFSFFFFKVIVIIMTL